MYHLRQALSGIRRAGFMSAACIIITPSMYSLAVPAGTFQVATT